MAREVKLTFKADDGDLLAAFKRMQAALDDFDKKVKSVTESMKKMMGSGVGGAPPGFSTPNNVVGSGPVHATDVNARHQKGMAAATGVAQNPAYKYFNPPPAQHHGTASGTGDFLRSLASSGQTTAAILFRTPTNAEIFFRTFGFSARSLANSQTSGIARSLGSETAFTSAQQLAGVLARSRRGMPLSASEQQGLTTTMGQAPFLRAHIAGFQADFDKRLKQIDTDLQKEDRLLNSLGKSRSWQASGATRRHKTRRTKLANEQQNILAAGEATTLMDDLLASIEQKGIGPGATKSSSGGESRTPTKFENMVSTINQKAGQAVKLPSISTMLTAAGTMVGGPIGGLVGDIMGKIVGAAMIPMKYYMSSIAPGMSQGYAQSGLSPFGNTGYLLYQNAMKNVAWEGHYTVPEAMQMTSSFMGASGQSALTAGGGNKTLGLLFPNMAAVTAFARSVGLSPSAAGQVAGALANLATPGTLINPMLNGVFGSLQGSGMSSSMFLQNLVSAASTAAATSVNASPSYLANVLANMNQSGLQSGLGFLTGTRGVQTLQGFQSATTNPGSPANNVFEMRALASALQQQGQPTGLPAILTMMSAGPMGWNKKGLAGTGISVNSQFTGQYLQAMYQELSGMGPLTPSAMAKTLGMPYDQFVSMVNKNGGHVNMQTGQLTGNWTSGIGQWFSNKAAGKGIGGPGGKPVETIQQALAGFLTSMGGYTAAIKSFTSIIETIFGGHEAKTVGWFASLAGNKAFGTPEHAAAALREAGYQAKNLATKHHVTHHAASAPQNPSNPFWSKIGGPEGHAFHPAANQLGTMKDVLKAISNTISGKLGTASSHLSSSSNQLKNTTGYMKSSTNNLKSSTNNTKTEAEHLLSATHATKNVASGMTKTSKDMYGATGNLKDSAQSLMAAATLMSAFVGPSISPYSGNFHNPNARKLNQTFVKTFNGMQIGHQYGTDFNPRYSSYLTNMLNKVYNGGGQDNGQTLAQIFSQVGMKTGIPSGLLAAIAAQESGGSWNAPGGGMMQVTGNHNHNAYQNAMAGAQVLLGKINMLVNRGVIPANWQGNQNALAKIIEAYNGDANFMNKNNSWTSIPNAGYAASVLDNWKVINSGSAGSMLQFNITIPAGTIPGNQF